MGGGQGKDLGSGEAPRFEGVPGCLTVCVSPSHEYLWLQPAHS